MATSKKSNKKPIPRKRKVSQKASSETASTNLSPLAGLEINPVSTKPATKTERQKLVYKIEVTDPDALGKDLDIKQKLGEMFDSTGLERYLASDNPEYELRELRKVTLGFSFSSDRTQEYEALLEAEKGQSANDHPNSLAFDHLISLPVEAERISYIDGNRGSGLAYLALSPFPSNFATREAE